MTLTHIRAIWGHAGCYHQVIKHRTITFIITANTVKDLLALRACMCNVKHFSVACLKMNAIHEFTDLSDQSHNSFSYVLQKSNLSTSCAHVQNAKAKNVVSTVLDEIDIHKIKEQVQIDRKKYQNNNILVIDRVKEMVAKKSDEKIANLGPEDQKKLNVIKLEHSFLFSEGHTIPDSEQMRSEYWLQALELPSMAQRLKYYTFLSKRNYAKESAKLKQAVKKEKAQEIEKPEKEPYEHGRLFMRIYESTMKRWLNYRLAASMQFGIPLVIDMDYASHMHPREIKNTASQLHDLYTLNRLDDKDLPFHLHFTNCQNDNTIFRLFQLRLQDDQDVLLTVSEKSYLDLFDKKSLVYLSPNGSQIMTDFDPNAVYIIGGFNDKAEQQPLSYARAKEQRIKCQRLPLDLYLKWNLGSKSLTLDQMMKIMMSLKNKNSWQDAFQAIPKRKLRRSDNFDQ